MHRFDGLIATLQAVAPRDVVMPVREGEKRPMFAHTCSRWSWRKLAEYRAEAAPSAFVDACVVLHDLCVVDVDSHELARGLEERFPVLLAVPTENTERGRHYWFRRSVAADEHGYFDGRAQVCEGVDFKTRTSSGSGGIVVVAPSGKRTFVRDLTADALVDIPDDLLRAVAKPRRVQVSLPFRFRDSSEEAAVPLTVPKRALELLSYFEPFLEGDFGSASEIPVPCTREEFVRAVDLVMMAEASDASNASNDEGDDEGDDEEDDEDEDDGGANACAEEGRRRLLAGTMGVVGKLGGLLDGIADAVVRRGRDLYASDLEAFWPEMAAATASRRELVALHPELRAISYLPLPASVERYGTRVELAPFDLLFRPERGADLLRRDDDVGGVEKRIPEVVLGLMERYPLVLAGGAPLGIMTSGVVEEGRDWDLFVHGLDEQGADAVLRRICEELADGWKLYRSGRAWTFTRADETRPPSWLSCPYRMHLLHRAHRGGIRRLPPGRTTVQIILNLYDTPEQVPFSFDIAPCQIAAWFEAGGRLVVRATEACVESLRRLAFPVSLETWGASSVSRSIKYARKGFEVVLPGVRRALLNPMTSPRPGVCGLLYAEHAIRRSAAQRPTVVGAALKLLSSAESDDVVKQVLAALSATNSGYSSDDRMWGRLASLWTKLTARTARTAPSWTSVTLWRRYEGRGRGSIMHPAPALFRDLHDRDAYTAVACADLGIDGCFRSLSCDDGTRRSAIARQEGHALLAEAFGKKARSFDRDGVFTRVLGALAARLAAKEGEGVETEEDAEAIRASLRASAGPVMAAMTWLGDANWTALSRMTGGADVATTLLRTKNGEIDRATATAAVSDFVAVHRMIRRHTPLVPACMIPRQEPPPDSAGIVRAFIMGEDTTSALCDLFKAMD
jgi:hypothetical protein